MAILGCGVFLIVGLSLARQTPRQLATGNLTETLSGQRPALFPDERSGIAGNLDNKTSLDASPEASFQIRVPIIMYHRVGYLDNQEGDTVQAKLTVSPQMLERQIAEFMASGYQFLFVKDLADILLKQEAISRPAVVLTFDDGYADFYRYAWPILRKYQVKATVFIVLNFLDQPGYLTLDELKELQASGLVEIGSHTLNHHNLKPLPLERARKEVLESKTRLESLLGWGVYSFAYPYGAFLPETLQIVREAGYTAAVASSLGVTHSHESRFRLLRVRPEILGSHNPVRVVELLQ